MAKTHNSEGPPPPNPEPKMNYFQKLWIYRKYLVVEPFFFFYAGATYLSLVALRNFPLEKACAINLHYNMATCTAMLDKSILNITCPDNLNFTGLPYGATNEQKLLTIDSEGFDMTVCKAEVEAQDLTADVSGKRAPIAAIFPLIILLFAGGWSDRYNKRKPCMIVPIIGEGLSYTGLLISAIFYDELPMEFGAYVEAIVPALFGGLTFCLMGIYSYITIATPEEDRVFRFGIFAMFVTALPFLNIASGPLLSVLGYKWSFAMGALSQLIAILYIIFFLEEIKPPKKKSETNEAAPQLQSQAADNLAFETTNLDELPINKNVNFQLTPPKIEPPPVPVPQRRNLCKELFDPTLLVDCIRFPFTKRENNGRMLLILLLLAYFLTTGPAAGEGEYFYVFTIKKLSWNGNDNGIYNAVSGGLALIGTFLGTAILSKLLKFPDSMVGMISAIAIVISRFIFAYSSTTTSFYIATVFDMFSTLRVIAIKTIGSSIVAGDELSKMYSIFGISEPIGQFIFPPIFSAIYQSTLGSFPGAFFLFGELFFIPNVLVFILCYFVIRRRKANDNSVELAQNNDQSQNGQTNAGSEITSL